jgi:hypothetical protein
MRKRHGRYVLDGLGTASATLRTRGGMRRGTVALAGGTAALPVTVNDFWCSGVTLGPPDAAIVRLAPGRAFAPGGPVEWRMERTFRGHVATVGRGTDRISVRQAAFFGARIEIEVIGDWARLDLVALSACFAVMSRRRGQRLRTLAVVGAIGHAGPV